MRTRSAPRRALTALTGLVVLGGLSLSLAVVAPAGAAAGDPSQWGAVRGQDPEFPVTPNLSRKVNEYEGQHRRVGGGDLIPAAPAGQDPEMPVSPN